MHCPRCGQIQVSEDIKFCSRCGFQLGLVAQLLENGGVLPQLADLYQGKRPLFTRKNGIIFSIMWFIIFVMMLPAFFGIAGADDIAAVAAVFGVFTTLLFVIASLGFLKKTPKNFELPSGAYREAVPTSLYGNAEVGALPQQRSQPVSDYHQPQGSWRASDTGELARPGSVTESTTRLLKKDE